MKTLLPSFCCRASWGILAAFLVVLITLMGCSGKPAGEAWAARQLGGGQAEELRRDVMAKLQLGFSGGAPVTIPTSGKKAYLPRPYAVFEERLDPKNPNQHLLVYSPLNVELAFTMTRPRGVVILQQDTRSKGRDRKGRIYLENITRVDLLDLEGNVITSATVGDRKDTGIRSFLESLPGSAP